MKKLLFTIGMMMSIASINLAASDSDSDEMVIPSDAFEDLAPGTRSSDSDSDEMVIPSDAFEDLAPGTRSKDAWNYAEAARKQEERNYRERHPVSYPWPDKIISR